MFLSSAVVPGSFIVTFQQAGPLQYIDILRSLGLIRLFSV